MIPKTTSLQQLREELNNALTLIETSAEDSSDSPVPSSNIIGESESLLEQYEGLVQRGKKAKPVIRIIHHLACSGGTLVSKCISALPNTYLLSEVHPTTVLNKGNGKPSYRPSDLTLLCRYAELPKVDSLAWKVFKSDVAIISSHILNFGGALVLREHSHSDYCVGTTPVVTSQLVDNLKEHFTIYSLATVRHPVDCFISMKLNKWLHFEPSTFDEYCRRYLLFIEQFEPEQLIKYEEFVSNSDEKMQEIASKLKLPYSGSYRDTFPYFKVTGDSGRGSNVIDKRPRRSLPEGFAEEIKTSGNYDKIIEILGYENSVL